MNKREILYLLLNLVDESTVELKLPKKRYGSRRLRVVGVDSLMNLLLARLRIEVDEETLRATRGVRP